MNKVSNKTSTNFIKSKTVQALDEHFMTTTDTNVTESFPNTVPVISIKTVINVSNTEIFRYILAQM